MLCVSAIEELVCDDKVIEEPWIGFVHQARKNNYEWYPDLEHLVKNEYFLKSIGNCHGLFTLTCSTKEFLLENLNPKVPVARVMYPITPFPPDKKFNWRKFNDAVTKKVLFIGEYLRKYQSIFDLEVPNGFQKYLLKSPDVIFDELLDCSKQPLQLEINDSVIIQHERVSDEEYDDLLSSSIVFLDLYDAVANTTAIECLSRNTPLIVNRLSGIEEYLGTDYPLYYGTPEEAASIFNDRERLIKGVEYLKKQYESHSHMFSTSAFLKAFANSSIYRSLPLPPSQQQDLQQTKFPLFDVTLVVCCYKRVYNLKHQLECFKQQDYSGQFELILWNNNPDTHQEVASIAAPYINDLHISLIQSTTNYYCIIRLAVARLMHSDTLLICDDDVIPKPSYISTFLSKYKEYGPRVALCCRAHVFTKPHSLNEEEPEKFWESHQNEVMMFCDEKVPDRQVSYPNVIDIVWLHFIKFV